MWQVFVEKLLKLLRITSFSEIDIILASDCVIYWETFQVEELSNKHVTELLGICALVIGVEYFTKKQAEPERLCYLVQGIVFLKLLG